jgi:co-chaperonin GroES (HSP10)
MKIKAVGDKVLALMIDSPDGYRATKSGILVDDKDATSNAVRPRWFEVYAIGPKSDESISVGQYVYVAHGRWTHGIEISNKKIYSLDNEEILAVSDKNPME